MIEGFLALLGSLSIILGGAVMAFFGALGNEAPVYVIGIIIGIVGIGITGFTIFGWFA